MTSFIALLVIIGTTYVLYLTADECYDMPWNILIVGLTLLVAGCVTYVAAPQQKKTELK